MDDQGRLLRLARAIREAGPKARERGESIVRKATLDVERGAKVRAPVDTGNLRNSISSDVRASATETSGEVGPTANYGEYVERGTSRMAPQPYLGPALAQVEPGFVDAVGKILEELL